MTIYLLLFDGFETLDAFGPAEVLGKLPQAVLRCVSLTGGTVRSAQGIPVATERADQGAGEIWLLPGGPGTRILVNNEDFLSLLRGAACGADWMLSVCTGSGLLARCGVLDGRRATSNKRAMDWAQSQGANVDWQGRARWTVDGKFYTSSGVSAGMDMALGFVRDRFGGEQAQAIAQRIEYLWNDDPECDPFAL